MKRVKLKVRGYQRSVYQNVRLYLKIVKLKVGGSLKELAVKSMPDYCR